MSWSWSTSQMPPGQIPGAVQMPPGQISGAGQMPSGQVPGVMQMPPGQIPGAVQMPPVGQGAYTPEQIIAWQQYQQQYQQWHEKYYEQYQKEMQSKLGTSAPVASPYQMMPSAIISPYLAQPPPPITSNAVFDAQPPPPPPPEASSNPTSLNSRPSYNFQPELKSTSIDMPTNQNSRTDVNTNYSDNLHAASKSNVDLKQFESSTNKPHVETLPVSAAQNVEMDKTPEEKVFDEQFRKWEEQFENWKKENVHHPDRKAYSEYEKQFEDVRKKLIERRNAMIKRKLDQQVQQVPQDFVGMKNQIHPNQEIMEPTTQSNYNTLPQTQSNYNTLPQTQSNYNTLPQTQSNYNTLPPQIQGHTKHSNFSSAPSFYTNNCNTIPGLDLVEKSFSKDVSVDKKAYECNYSTDSNKNPRNLHKNTSLFVDTVSDKKPGLLNHDRESQNFMNNSNISQTNTQKKIPSLLDQRFEKPDFMNTDNSSIKNNRNKAQNNKNQGSTKLNDEKANITNFNPLTNQNLGFSNKSNVTVLSNEKVNIPNLNMSIKQQSQHQAMPQNNVPSTNIAALANVLSDPNVMAILNAALKSNNSIDAMAPNNSSNSTILSNANCSSIHPNSDKPQFSEFLKQKQPVNRLFNPKDRQYVTEVVPQPKFTDNNLFYSNKNQWSDESKNDSYSDNIRDNNSISNLNSNQNERENISNPFSRNIPNRDTNFEDEFYRPAQVIDYQNKSASKRQNPFSDGIVPKKVVDYGHRPSSMIRHNNNDVSSFIPAKTIDYAHASSKSDKIISDKKREELIISRRERKRIKREEMELMKPIYESNENYPGPWLLLNEEVRKRPGFPTKRGKPKKIKALVEKKKQVITADNNPKEEFDEQDFEEISDEDEMSFNNDKSTKVNDSPISFKSKKNDDIIEILNSPKEMDKTVFNDQTPKPIFPVQMIFPTNENNNTIAIDEILLNPGRKSRPKKIVVILRGPPGSGKSYVARLIKEKENDLSGAPVRLLSIDDYFMVETDKTEKCPKTGRPINKKIMIYEFDEKMEEKYVEYLIKAYRKTLSDNLYDFVIIDYGNQSLRTFTEFYNTAKSYNYTPYTIDMIADFNTCSKQNDHKRSLDDIKYMVDNWKETPKHYIKLNISSLLHQDTEDIEMDTISLSDSENSAINEIKQPNSEDNSETAEAEAELANSSNFLKSKWDTDFSVEGLARLDGASKKSYQKRSTMQDYLQLEDIWEPPQSSDSKKKRVRWADIEEKKAQDKMRAIGFIVGQTDWNRMMDPTQGSSALTKTKYIDKVKKPYRK